MNPESAAEAQKMEVRPTRLNLNLSEKARAELDRLATKAGCTFTELVRLGLMLARVYHDLGPGETLAVARDGKLVKEILPPVGF